MPVQKEQSPSRTFIIIICPSLRDPGALRPSLRMPDMHTDQELKAEAELLWNHVSSQNLGYRWLDRASNQRLLRETGMRFVTCINRECQLRLFGHVAPLPEADPARQVRCTGELTSWRRRRGSPCASRWIVTVRGSGWVGYLRGGSHVDDPRSIAGR